MWLYRFLNPLVGGKMEHGRRNKNVNKKLEVKSAGRVGELESLGKRKDSARERESQSSKNLSDQDKRSI